MSSSAERPDVYYLRCSLNFETFFSDSVEFNRLTSKEAKFLQLDALLAEAGLELALELALELFLELFLELALEVGLEALLEVGLELGLEK